MDLTTSDTRDRLEFRLVIGDRLGRETEVVVDVAVSATTGQFIRELGQIASTMGGDLRAYLARERRFLDDGDTVSGVVVQGDTLYLIPVDATTGWTPPVSPSQGDSVAVVGGPDAGRGYPLGDGSVVVGRGVKATISLDDPSLSGSHLSVTRDGRRTVLRDLSSTNGTILEGAQVPSGQSVDLPYSAVFQAGRSLFQVVEVGDSRRLSPGHDGRVSFNRPPRSLRARDIRPVVIPAPPAEPPRARLPLAACVVPLAIGGTMFAIVHQVQFLLFTVLSPIMAVGSLIEDRRSGRGKFKRDAAAYRTVLADLATDIATGRTEEVNARRAAAPNPFEVVDRVARHLPTLWERRPGDPDFLRLRVGMARQPSSRPVSMEPGGSARLRTEGEALLAAPSLPAVPIEVDGGDAACIGLYGNSPRIVTLARWLILQTATLHSPRDVVVAAAVSDAAAWRWLSWLPHTAARNDLGGEMLARTHGSAAELCRRIAALANERTAPRPGARPEPPLPHVVLLIDEQVAPSRALVSKILTQAAAASITVIWLGAERRELPGECTYEIGLEPGAARLSVGRRDGQADDVNADGVAIDVALAAARGLAPLVDATASSRAGSIPTSLKLIELLRLPDDLESEIAARWSRPSASLGAPIGSGAEGPVTVDLRRDGPHGLVAGTTGAGKSELLQTLVVSLAVSHPAQRLTFLLVDYKGGAAFRECTRLPHVVGLVTDLDQRLTHRALVSLNAELKRREHLLYEAGATDIIAMERSHPDIAPPNLLIVIDEFATLAKDVPAFVDGVVDVAQRGRSLGIHLLLATQRPGGVVSQSIRANTNLRIALRVASEGESEDVIESPSAAAIPRSVPGRAFLRIGATDLSEFQTAYAGGVSAQSSRPQVKVRNMTFDGTARHGTTLAGDIKPTDIVALVTAISAVHTDSGQPAPRPPWVPALDEVIDLETLDPVGYGSTDIAVLGVIDEPILQRQRLALFNLANDGSLIVLGTSGSGKTTLARSIAMSLARGGPPDDLHLYGLDFGTRGLQPLEALPHCGAVIDGDDHERVIRLFRMLARLVAERKRLFSEHQAGTIAEYRRAAGRPLPRIVVLLEDYGTFVTTCASIDRGRFVDAVPRLIAEARPLGIHFVLTASRRADLPSSLHGIIPRRVVLRLANEDEYASLGIDFRPYRGSALPPGRGFVEGGAELQCAIVGGAGALADSTSATAAAAAAVAAGTSSDRRAPSIRRLPVVVPRDALPAPTATRIPIGLSDSDLEPAILDLSLGNVFVAGPYRSGRSTLLATIALAARAANPDIELHLLAPRTSPLLKLGVWTSVASGMEDCTARAAELLGATRGLDGTPLTPLRVLVVIDNGEEMVDMAAPPALETLVRASRTAPIRLVAAVERTVVGRVYGGWLAEIKKEEIAVLLDPDVDGDARLVGLNRLPAIPGDPVPPGRGVLAQAGSILVIQAASDGAA